MSKQVVLRLVASREQARGESQLAELAVANNAVPIMWLAMFAHEDLEIRKLPNRSQALFAYASLDIATGRVESTLEKLPDTKAPIAAAARSLLRELRSQAEDGFLVLYPVQIFTDLPWKTARAYLAQLTHLCDLWQHLRGGTSWPETRKILERISPDVNAALDHPDKRLARYFLVGSLADKQPSLDDFGVREGAGQDDVEPEALAVGEQGLVIGRFEGVWKLLSSGTAEDLRAVWAEGETTFLAGRRGTIVQLKSSQATVMDTPTQAHLNGVFGLSARSVCAVGDSGTVIAYNGQSWQPWPIPTHAPLQRVWGTGTENLLIGGQESGTYRFDGYAWNRTPLPTEGIVTGLTGDDVETLLIAGTSQGGMLLSLGRDGWQRVSHPRMDWLEGLWKGWEDEIGLVSGGGAVCHRRQGQWISERLPLDQVYGAACGYCPMVVGICGEHAAVVALTDEGWRYEVSVRGMQLYGLWVSGEAMPPRLQLPTPEPAPRDSTTPASQQPISR